MDNSTIGLIVFFISMFVFFGTGLYSMHKASQQRKELIKELIKELLDEVLKYRKEKDIK